MEASRSQVLSERGRSGMVGSSGAGAEDVGRAVVRDDAPSRPAAPAPGYKSKPSFN